MRFRSTLVLLLLLAGLGAYVYWVEVPQSEQEAKKKTLFEFKADDVTEVSLVFSDREIVVKKAGDDWKLTKPLEATADSTIVKNLISAIAEAEVKKTFDDASNLAQYGLDQPFVKVTVKLKDKELPTILVGKSTPVGFSAYIKKADEPKVVLTTSAFRSGMDKKVKDLRDKTILNFADKDVQKIEIHGEGKDLALVQKDDRWSIERPGTYAVDAVAMRTFLSTLRSMRAVDFATDQPTDLGSYGLDQPRLKVSLYLGKDNAEKDIMIGKDAENKQLYVQGSGQPTVYIVSGWILSDLNKGVNDFRDKTLLAFDRDKIASLDVKRKDGGHFKFVRDDKQWRVEGIGEGKPAQTIVSQYIGDLHDLVGYEIVADHPSDLSALGLDQPLLTLSLLGEENRPIGTVLLGSRPGDSPKKEYTAMTEGGETVFLVRDYLFTRLDKQPQDFVEKPPASPALGTPAAQLNPGAEEPGDEPMGDEPMGGSDPGDEPPGGEQD
ncbi:MAG: DUF4340 domain-containing protein [Candidatus Binatia bacterium]